MPGQCQGAGQSWTVTARAIGASSLTRRVCRCQSRANRRIPLQAAIAFEAQRRFRMTREPRMLSDRAALAPIRSSLRPAHRNTSPVGREVFTMIQTGAVTLALTGKGWWRPGRTLHPLGTYFVRGESVEAATKCVPVIVADLTGNGKDEVRSVEIAPSQAACRSTTYSSTWVRRSYYSVLVCRLKISRCHSVAITLFLCRGMVNAIQNDGITCFMTTARHDVDPRRH